ncbi:Scr1 family TA system antitoxin-like transcriptional regulator, partial [Streptomyces sp. NPDC088194]|uniref:Scr1 family TA system antitoxin-like transcriptional regulator n=1 Tax=Streptomyces sp. NPDC088194 TaxID=3154931 RepID=UPI00344F678B
MAPGQTGSEGQAVPRTGALEADAVSVQEYAVSAVPYLLQTRAYAEEQLRTARPRSIKQLSAQVAA